MKKLALIFTIIIASMASFSPTFAGDINAGKAKSASCIGCHGADGHASVPMYPSLAGQNEAYLAKQLKAFKNGSRKDPIMSGMAMPLTNTDIDNLASYYQSLK